ncbi:MAG: hemerythrin domain-containing protein [Planctomycetaceae bacterium]|nr:hypothetical protein [Planctomycetota bacterium]NUO17103.1 hemerythrin domain-containing protein [Planctomycetaceae bacterium]GIK53179.1 MAG: hypothetical protein BroJett014_21520 [Planctomycetota bacterium]
MSLSPEREPLVLLVGAHRELKQHLHALVRAGRLLVLGRGDLSLAAQISRALRFLAVDVPLHARDEEESLLPRLRAKLKDPQSHFAYLLEHIEKDHAELAQIHTQFDQTARKLVARIPFEGCPARKDLEPDLKLFRGQANELLNIYTSHMLVEERDIFPALSIIFTPAEREDIARELAERRGYALA